MNKEIVEHYGWIVVVLIVGFVMMMMATPLGNFVYSNVRMEAVDALIESKIEHKQSSKIEDSDLLETYDITYNIGNAKWEGNYITSYIYNKETVLPTNVKHNEPEKYSFGGWYIQGTSASNIITSVPETKSGDIKLVANWIGREYTITYNTNGATFTNSAYRSYYRFNSGTVQLPKANEMTKAGYTFGGWYTKSDFSGTKYTSINTDSTTGNLTYYAKWIKN